MNKFKNLFPFIAAIGVFFLACNSSMWKLMNQKPSVENEIKPISVEEFLDDLYELTSSYENDLSKQALAEMLRDRADFLLRD